MKVIATAMGFAGRLIQEGERFEMPEGSKASWFEEVKDEAAKKPGKTEQVKGKPADEPLT